MFEQSCYNHAEKYHIKDCVVSFSTTYYEFAYNSIVKDAKLTVDCTKGLLMPLLGFINRKNILNHDIEYKDVFQY